MAKVARDYVATKKSLEILKNNPKVALTKEDEGFTILLNKWPNLKEKSSVEYIGRTVAFVSFGPQVKNDIQLVLYDKNEEEIKNRWNMSEVEEILERIIDWTLDKSF